VLDAILSRIYDFIGKYLVTDASIRGLTMSQTGFVDINHRLADMVIVELLRNEFNDLTSGSTLADCVLKLEDWSSGRAVERFCVIEFESSWRRMNNVKHLGYAFSVINAYANAKKDPLIDLIVIHWMKVAARKRNYIDYSCIHFLPYWIFLRETDKDKLLASLRGNDPGTLATTMDILRVFGLILNSPTDFELYMECVKLAHNRVLTTPETQKRYLEIIMLIARECLTKDQVKELKMTLPLKSIFEEAREEGREEGWQKGLDVAALALLKDGDSVERIKKLLGLPEKRIRKLKAQLRSERATDPEAS
jgi:hypothetical protein